MSYGEKYRLEYKDQILEGQPGRKTTIKILQKDYTGSVTEIKGGKDPLIISASTDSDYMFSQIVASSAKITLISEVSFQFLEFFTANAREYLVEVWKEPTPGETQIFFWTGYGLPDNYIEPLNDYKNYGVTLQAIDGLGRLKDIDFLKEDGTQYEGKWTLDDLLKEILLTTGLVLPRTYALYFDEIYSGDNKWIFNKIYVDVAAFYFKEVPKMEYVLKQILQAFGARIIQSKGAWVIKEVTKNTRSHSIYKSDLSTEVYNPIKSYSRTRDYNRLLIIKKEGDLQINPAYKSFQINHDFLLKKSVVTNGDFEKFTLTDTRTGGTVTGRRGSTSTGSIELTSLPGWTKTPSDFKWRIGSDPGRDGNYLKLTPVVGAFNASYYIVSDPVPIDLSNRESYFSIEVRDAYCESWLELKIGEKWVNNEGALVTTQYKHHLSFTGNEIDFTKYEVSIQSSADIGNLTVKMYRPYYATPRAGRTPIFDIDNVTFKYVAEDVTDKITFSVDVDKNNNYIPKEIDSILGDVPNVKDREDIYLGMFWRFDQIYVPSIFGIEAYYIDTYVPSLMWKNEEGNQATILQLLAEAIMDTHYKPKKYLTGLRLKGNFDFDSSLQIGFLEDTIFLPINYEYSDKYAEWSIDAVEVLATRLMATEDEDYIMTENDDYILI